MFSLNASRMTERPCACVTYIYSWTPLCIPKTEGLGSWELFFSHSVLEWKGKLKCVTDVKLKHTHLKHKISVPGNIIRGRFLSVES